MITSKEVQEMLKVSSVTLWRYRKSGRIPYFRYGNVIRYRPEDVMRFVNHNVVGEGEKQYTRQA